MKINQFQWFINKKMKFCHSQIIILIWHITVWNLPKFVHEENSNWKSRNWKFPQTKINRFSLNLIYKKKEKHHRTDRAHRHGFPFEFEEEMAHKVPRYITTLTRWSVHHLRYDLYKILLLQRSRSVSSRNWRSRNVTFFMRCRMGSWPRGPPPDPVEFGWN